MNVTKKSIALAVGGALALSVSATSFAEVENPFAIKSLSSGYQVADHHAEKGADGKCGEGKCGADKAKEMKDGKCGADKAKEMKDGKCGEGKCGEGKAKKMKDGKCGH